MGSFQGWWVQVIIFYGDNRLNFQHSYPVSCNVRANNNCPWEDSKEHPEKSEKASTDIPEIAKKKNNCYE